ncbi:DUF4907 domain-containing protein [Deminuibacter soli]|uniref:DUF4907 domain-containing protein n=1 Tax=Deminuibacter soli TaxID=2291815 RepID=A0A3E1NRB9_9BACT|nr:DUF4907 domain-containing protein [Deminuibacter soli]RFM30486.1 DUF4907 domain-containing protein [Deminuibacter soli]
MTKAAVAALGGCMLSLLIIACSGGGKHKNHEGQVPVDVRDTQLNNGWGFIISVNHKPYIVQQHIPMLQGSNAFASKEDALKVGNLMMSKMVKGETLPVVTERELDSLQITIPK